MKVFFFVFILWGSYTSVLAQVLRDIDPLITDRPGLGTDAPAVLDPGHVQIELGFLYQDDPISDQQLLLYPNALVRIGVTERFELRASADLFQEGIGASTFVSPIVLGTKIGITESQGIIPQSALIVNVTLPREGPFEVWNPIATPEMRLLMTHSLTQQLSLTTNFSIAWEADPVAIRYPNHAYAASLDISISDYVAAFGEFYGFWSQLDHSQLFNLGSTVLLLPDLQLDLSGGFGISENAPDYFVSSGISVRF
ncbi:transporter [Tunicatimonas pelagia]|uniref:transporter n=1 Tax=Tunicatimonas pelagia TaxID=931531 RepID=UPI002666E058|nr:transporter [Tunicatimonas pelagia]WKN42833.1 transporter [Tunicatimonas pelagia]